MGVFMRSGLAAAAMTGILLLPAGPGNAPGGSRGPGRASPSASSPAPNAAPARPAASAIPQLPAALPATAPARARGTAGLPESTIRRRERQRERIVEALQAERSRAGGDARRVSSPRARGHRVAALRAADLMESSGAAVSTGDLRHVPYRMSKLGRPIFNRRGRLHERGGAVAGRTGPLLFPPLAQARWTIPAEKALAIAERRTGTRGHRAPPRVEQGWYAGAGETRPVWRATLAAAQPLATWQVTVDAKNGAVLDSGNMLRHVTGSGRAYPENIVTTPAPVELPLYELDDSGLLAGRIVRVFDLREAEAFRPDFFFDFPESDPRFVQTAAYRGITDAGLLAESLGFPLFEVPVPTFTNWPGPGGGEYNNAFYDPFFPLIGLGNGDGALTANLGTDLDVAAHELGHHVFQLLVDPDPSQVLLGLAAMNEAVADTVAVLLSNDPEVGESTLPGRPYLRTLDNTASYPLDVDADPHRYGLIFGGLNWSLIQIMGPELFGRVLVAALPYLSPAASDPDEYRDALILGDRDVTQGAYEGDIARLSNDRGFDFWQESGYAGFLEEGSPQQGSLARDGFAIYLFSEFPGSRELRFRLTGSGDADLAVGPLETFDLGDYLFSGEVGTDESIRITAGTLPSVDSSDLWAIVVEDWAGDNVGSDYVLTVESELPAPQIGLDVPLDESLDEAGEVDYVIFEGTGGSVVRLEATAQTEALDLVAGIFEPRSGELLAADDDSGPGFDPLIQGVRLPASGPYAIIVISPFGDVDPTAGTGPYRLHLSLCTEVAPDFDADGLADACDDDDDDDTFNDAADSAPFDDTLCYDLDGDSCDDCSGGGFDPFDDGPDSDGDIYCDAGDPDDDNDGCVDERDPSPLSPSADPDLDFLGDDCDLCPDDWDPGQEDADADGIGDVCDPTPIPEPSGGWGAVLLVLSVLKARSALKARRRGVRQAAGPGTRVDPRESLLS